MADLSTYLSFAIILDNSVSPGKVRIVDTSNYPSGVANNITGLMEVTQPDGITLPADVTFINGQLSQPEIEMRLDSAGQVPMGAWRFKYTASHPAYDDTVLERVVTINFRKPNADIVANLDVFSPNLSVTDASNYLVAGMALQNVTRSWLVEVVGVGQITSGNTQTLSLSYNGQFYDADYDVSFIAVGEWQRQGFTWLTVKEKISDFNQYSAETPPVLAALIQMLSDFKLDIDQDSKCKCDPQYQQKYIEAVSILQHILMRGQFGLTLGLDSYIYDLIRIFNEGQLPAYQHTLFPIPSYQWLPPGSPGSPYSMANLGAGVGPYKELSGNQFRMRSFVDGTNSEVVQENDTIKINVNAGEINEAENVGNGEPLFLGKDGAAILIRSLLNGSNISFTQGPNGELVINAANPSTIGEANTLQSLGDGASLVGQKNNSVLPVRSIKGENGISAQLSQDGNSVVIRFTGTISGGTSSSNVTAQNVGTSGEGIFIQKTPQGVLQLRKLLGENGIQIEPLPAPSLGLRIRGAIHENTGTGEGSVYAGFNGNAHLHKRLKQGANVVITETASQITISFPNPSPGGAALPIGGTIRQILTKQSSVDGDATWEDLPDSPPQIVAIGVNVNT